MDPVLFTYQSPVHEQELVARHVLREHLADHLSRWRRMAGADELVYLATCQRALWIFWGGDGEALGFPPNMSRYEGHAAWKHLLEVGTGLASANLGDREIVDQLWKALQMAKEAGAAGEEAQAALEDIVRESQRLRSRIGLADGSASVATAALRRLEGVLKPGARVVLVGVGPMCRYLAERLPERGFQVTLSNRTAARAEAFGLPTVPLEQLQWDPIGFDALVTATASTRPIFTLEAWKHVEREPLFLLDLALPCDSEAVLSRLPWVLREDLADFLRETDQGRDRRREAASLADPLLAGAVKRLMKRSEERDHRHHLRGAQDRLSEAWEALEIEATGPGGSLAGLDQAQTDALRTLLRRGRTLAFRTLNVHRDPLGD